LEPTQQAQGNAASPTADQEAAADPAPEWGKHAGICASHSSLALAVKKASREAQHLSTGE